MINSEREYYNYLVKTIKEQKQRFHIPFFSRNNKLYDMDIHMIMKYIQQHNPHLTEILSNTNTTNLSRQDIQIYLNTTKKGTILKWQNEKGEDVLLLNRGSQKKALEIKTKLNKADFRLLQKSIFDTILKKDIERIYNQIRQIELKKASKTIVTIDTNKKETPKKTTSDFERSFKELIKKQGDSCDPMFTASYIIEGMSAFEKGKLSESLNTHGIKDSNSLNHLLNKWKNEALHPEIITIKHKHKQNKTQQYSRGR